MVSRYNFRRVYQRAVARAGHDLAAVDPHGPHDLHHTFSTWLEDAGIPARVIDELMGHERSRRGELEDGSRIGARYRHTTPEMAVGVAAAIQERLVAVARSPTRSSRRRLRQPSVLSRLPVVLLLTSVKELPLLITQAAGLQGSQATEDTIRQPRRRAG